MSDEIIIRRAETPADYLACQAAQRKAWGITEDGYLVPVATMVAAQLHGGLVLGAFLPSGEAVALSFAFLARIDHRIGLYSQLTGVIPGYQDRGIGGRLKQLQREIAREEGCEVIAWAFDPLQAGNARFNLDKLCASSHHYIEDMYGPRSDALNAGVPTDRLIVTWEVDPARILKASPPPLETIPRLIVVEQPADQEPSPSHTIQPAGQPWLLLEVPSEIARLRNSNRPLADAWQKAVRLAFQCAFAAGYRAVGFERVQQSQVTRCFYVLMHELSR